MYRYVLRNGDVMMSDRSPESFATYCYLSGPHQQTCALLTDQAELSFLLNMGKEHHFNYG